MSSSDTPSAGRRSTRRLLVAVAVSVLATVVAPAALRGSAAGPQFSLGAVYPGEHSGAGGHTRLAHHAKRGIGRVAMAGSRHHTRIRVMPAKLGAVRHRSPIP